MDSDEQGKKGGTEPTTADTQPVAGVTESIGVSNVINVSDETQPDTQTQPDTHVSSSTQPNPHVEVNTMSEMSESNVAGRPKREVKLTAKALAAHLQKLQGDRNSKLKAAFSRHNKIMELMNNGETETEMRCEYDKCLTLYREAQVLHTSVLGLLPPDEKEKQEVWFQAYSLRMQGFVEEFNACLANNVQEVQQNEVHENDLRLGDTASETVRRSSKGSNKSSRKSKGSGSSSSGSSASRARREAEAERAALATRFAALQEKHALEEEEEGLRREEEEQARRAAEQLRIRAEQLRKRKEKLELETEMAVSDAKLAVWTASSQEAASVTRSDGMSSYMKRGAKTKEKPPALTLNPNASTYQPAATHLSAHVDPPQLVPVHSSATEQPATTQHSMENIGLQPATVHYRSAPQQPAAAQYPSVRVGLAHHQPAPLLNHWGSASQPAPVHNLSAPPQLTSVQHNTHGAPVHQQQPAYRSAATQDMLLSHPASTSLHSQAAPRANVSHTQTAVPGFDTAAFCNLMQAQNGVTTLLLQQQASHLLPPREIPCFDGDPLQYRPFIRAFEHCVEKNTSNRGDCLYYLDKYTSGAPKELVRSCQHMSPDQGYNMARNLLLEHFGNEHRITAAYMDKALKWPAIKPEDVKALQAYALFMRECCNAMLDIQYLQELNMPSTMKAMILKLPYKTREKWRATACDILEKQHRRAQFTDMVSFIERQVRIVTDPIFGDINYSQQHSPTGTGKPSTGSKDVSRIKSQKPRSYATAVTAVDAPADIGSADTHATEKGSTAKCTTGQRNVCICCSQKHTIEQCPKFEKKMHTDKIAFIKETRLCFGCLRTGHLSKDCGRRLVCKVCQRTHPSVLHIVQRGKGASANPKQAETASAKVATTTAGTAVISLQSCGQTGAGNGKGILSILPVQVKSMKGSKVIQTYAFLDPGSTDTFCSETLMRRLNLNGKKTQINLLTMGPKVTVPSSMVAGMEISSLTGRQFYELPRVYTQKKMPAGTSNIVREEDLAKWPYLDHLKIPRIQAEVELLIGTNASNLLEPWEVINSHGQGPYAIRTLLGWVINGPLKGCEEQEYKSGHPTVYANRVSVENLSELLNNQYNHDFNEATEDKEEMSREDVRFMEIMTKSVKLQDGHYSLDLPFKIEPSLPNNQVVAKQRILGLRRKLERNEKFHQEYTNFFGDMISEGYAERVPEHEVNRSDGRLWYIPHHGVHHPKKGTLRVVFDCGAEFRGKSLNGQLLQGPYLTSSLLGVLTRFRQEPVALMADIRSMFHQVLVTPKDRDFLRFLWWPGGDVTQQLEEYRMTAHLFGAVSSPSCACFALRRTAEDNQGTFSDKAIDTINRNFYMDDCLKSVQSEEEAVTLVRNLTDICHKGGFHLTKWTSNNREVLLSVPEEDRSKNLLELDLDRDQLPVERVLGLHWSVETDTFEFKLALKEKAPTRRGILSVVSSVYDPLGFLAPLTLPAKLILQELCRRNYGWDEDIPPALQQQWFKWLRDLEEVARFKIDRCLKPANFGRSIHGQLHHFSDASESGYGTVTYLRVENDSQIHVSFLQGKARVTPLKPVTIPRLELTAAVLAVRVDKMFRKELEMALTQSCFWTDSTSVLKYIGNEDKRFQTYVANRIAFIRRATLVSQWRYISTSQNPADEASRGLKMEQFLMNRRWTNGPEFLWKAEEEWPRSILEGNIATDDPEVKREVITNVVVVDDAGSATHQLLAYHSDWKRLKKSVAWILKIKMTLLEMSRKRKEMRNEESDEVKQEVEKIKAASRGQDLTPDDLSDAEMSILHFVQRERFPDEISALLSGREVKQESPISKLDPVLEHGLLRVGGRLSKAAMPEETKHPVILSKDQHVSALLLKYIHEQIGHGGRNHVLSVLRRKYWITSGNAATRKVLSNCCFCRRHRAKLGEQKMADLPVERLFPDLPPFTNVGVDYFGPIEVKKGRSMEKRWGVIFTCLACRAVHLEVAYSLDTDACINALRRFVCRRGQVSTLRSDNGTNFIGAERELREALAALNHSRIQGAVLQDGIKWVFNPPTASHHGGIWERVIRMIRRTLTSVLKQQTLNDETFHTVLCEVEAILNDRPITKLSEDPNDLEALTPNHLLTMKAKPILPPGLFEKTDCYIKRRWRQTQYISDLFWKRWLKEYLPLLQERQRWTKERRSLVPGDIVLVADSTAPRGSWPLGRILETFPDRRGLVRSAKLQTKTSTLVRPVTKLCLLQEAE